MNTETQTNSKTTDFVRQQARPYLLTGDKTLDRLLGGGVERSLTHLLYSRSKRLSGLLQQLAVLAQLPPPDGGFNATRVLYVDAENRFDPYGAAQFATDHRLDPTRTLGNIVVTRAFQWGQVVDTLREKLLPPTPENGVTLACIAGLNVLLPRPNDAHLAALGQVFQEIQHLRDQARNQYA